ncbi:MAG: hypothetical protein DWB56_06285 [Candidatus Jettenia sp.]|uniref:Uncharacterized protein n=1 Tax=Candidatus Jettenia caeni TaxID=247490 RepID=I3IR62_9BACT|nr:hypothetical protein [Candidatus Jettenia sp. AMX1]MBC6928562.1 hypothetical protein [Candidatus Jettenia sp.]NUN23465.1 hypothetical protein [Candidatus Jettenia caeni]KAA0249183.1 MAG: hypothetical protein EDM77_09805 [Candidatus Jettenia sp. AMX1]MCE7879781.1 hypothetical protein [Candidatus Jettenia sp. AMX1]MCQ3926462.1 hypothetical protein [Candidatus Jettenia sp.]
MVQNYFYQLRQLRVGMILALLTLLYGFGLGAAFGTAEDGMKGSLKTSAQEVYETVYKGDKAEMSKVTDKSWTYFKRAHLHANGMGAASLGMIILLSLLKGQSVMRMITAIGLGAGALGYSLFWLFAGMMAPGLGSTGLAKETLAWLAIPSGVMFLSGTIAVLVVFVWCVLKPTVQELG